MFRVVRGLPKSLEWLLTTKAFDVCVCPPTPVAAGSMFRVELCGLGKISILFDVPRRSGSRFSAEPAMVHSRYVRTYSRLRVSWITIRARAAKLGAMAISEQHLR